MLLKFQFFFSNHFIENTLKTYDSIKKKENLNLNIRRKTNKSNIDLNFSGRCLKRKSVQISKIRIHRPKKLWN